MSLLCHVTRYCRNLQHSTEQVCSYQCGIEQEFFTAELLLNPVLWLRYRVGIPCHRRGQPRHLSLKPALVLTVPVVWLNWRKRSGKSQ